MSAAALSGGTYLPEAAARSYFGDEIDCTYYTSSGRQSATFRFYGTDTFDSLPAYSNALSNYNQDVLTYCTNATFLVYSADLTGVVNDPTQIVVDLTPQYSIFDTSQIHCAIGLTGANYSTSAYISASWDWYFSGDTVHSESPLNEYGYGLRAQSRSLQSWFNLVPVNLESQSTTSGYSLRAVFPVADSQCYLIIGCPYVSLGSSGESGISGIQTGTTVTTSTVSGGTSVDLDETNGLLGGIIDAVVNLGDFIVDGVSGLFVPEEGFIESFENDLAELLQDTFGGIDNDMLINVIADLLTHGATESVTFPAINVPLTNFSTPAYSVPLKPNSAGLHSFYEAIALAIDLAATCAVLNLVQEKIKAFLVGEKVVDIQDAD